MKCISLVVIIINTSFGETTADVFWFLAVNLSQELDHVLLIGASFLIRWIKVMNLLILLVAFQRGWLFSPSANKFCKYVLLFKTAVSDGSLVYCHLLLALLSFFNNFFRVIYTFSSRLDKSGKVFNLYFKLLSCFQINIQIHTIPKIYFKTFPICSFVRKSRSGCSFNYSPLVNLLSTCISSIAFLQQVSGNDMYFSATTSVVNMLFMLNIFFGRPLYAFIADILDLMP